METKKFKNIEIEELVNIILSFEKIERGEYNYNDTLEIEIEENNVEIVLNYRDNYYRYIEFFKNNRLRYEINNIDYNITEKLVKNCLTEIF